MQKQKRQKFSRKQDLNRIFASMQGAAYSRFVFLSGKSSKRAKSRELPDMNKRFHGYRKMLNIKQRPPVQKAEE